jgi:hypothetical protein
MADLNDFNKPTITDLRTDVQDTNRAHHARAISLNPGTATNRPAGAKLAELISNVFTLKHWNGSAYDTWLSVSNFMRGLLGSANAGAALDGLGGTATGKAVFTATSALKAFEAVGLLPKRVWGFGKTIAFTSLATVTIQPGVAFTTNGRPIVLNTAITKTSSTWAAGNNAGGADVASYPTAWYYFYVIRNPTTGAVDVTFSLNDTTPALPSGFTEFAKIGVWEAEAAENWGWIDLVQIDQFMLRASTYPNLFTFAVPSTGIGNTMSSIDTPTGRCLVHFSAAINNTGSGAVRFYTDSTTGSAPSSINDHDLRQSSAVTTNGMGRFVVMSGTDGKVRARGWSAGASINVVVHGFDYGPELNR